MAYCYSPGTHPPLRVHVHSTIPLLSTNRNQNRGTCIPDGSPTATRHVPQVTTTTDSCELGKDPGNDRVFAAAHITPSRALRACRAPEEAADPLHESGRYPGLSIIDGDVARPVGPAGFDSPACTARLRGGGGARWLISGSARRLPGRR